MNSVRQKAKAEYEAETKMKLKVEKTEERMRAESLGVFGCDCCSSHRFGCSEESSPSKRGRFQTSCTSNWTRNSLGLCPSPPPSRSFSISMFDISFEVGVFDLIRSHCPSSSLCTISSCCIRDVSLFVLFVFWC